MKRGWVGRIDGEHVIQLAAQTLQAFFTGGASAREHAVYPLDSVCLLAPVLNPPSIRIFEGQQSFAFANPAAIMGPATDVEHRTADDWVWLDLHPRLAAIVGADGELGGFTILADWRAPDLPAPKDRDFALGLGPVVVTRDEVARRLQRQSCGSSTMRCFALGSRGSTGRRRTVSPRRERPCRPET